MTTQIGFLSVELLEYTPPNAASTATLSSTLTMVTSIVNESGTSAISSLLAITSAPSPSSGLSTGAKAGIGVAVPLAFIAFILGLLFCFLRRCKHSRAPEPQLETHDGGLPEHISTVSELKANLDSFPRAAYETRAEAGGVSIHEIAASQERPIHHELTADPLQYRARSLASPISPTFPTRKPVPSAEASPASFPPPWNSSGVAEYEENLRTSPTPEAEDIELAELKVEVALVKQKRERLQELQALEAREEELRDRILAREKTSGSKP